MTEPQHHTKPLIDEALHWLVVLREDDTPQTQADFRVWLDSGPEHAAAWRRAQDVWQRADILAPAMKETANVVSLPPRRAAVRWMSAAAACLLLVLTGYAIASADLLADHRTATAELRSISLKDGSEVQLSSATALSVEIGQDARIVTLHRGEAHFSVAPDAARPFIVRAAGGQTRALGTAFDVKIVSGGAIVTVTEHAVAVRAPDGQTGNAVEGQQIRYGAAGLSDAKAVDIAGAMAWRRNRLVFYDAPLGEVVADLERHRLGRIIVTDARLKSLPVTAVFDSAQTDAAIETIARTLPVKLRQYGTLLAVISPAD
ncbi:FecR family protein [Ferrovibrio terrae]|uniref:FecR family protein n=1 Tax=Ferrovibrio terrae TaxID=2594003 RepID=A0A516H441_9PROT|nr:FecR family protein [Ferrovibrio terrae]QDO98548.1 FecR family protein [Ferrovibrio terrae]